MSVIHIHTGTLEYLIAENISAAHCFTTRLGGVSSGYLSSLNIGAHRGDDPTCVEKNFNILADALGFAAERMILTRQTHSDIVRAVSAADAGKGIDTERYPECDALITNTAGVALVVFTADCTPILLHDPVTGAVGAIHAGWRGTAQGIAAKTVAAMVNHYGCDPKNICAAIGPNIGQCCFQTDADVPNALIAALGVAAHPFIRYDGRKYYVNLKEINALWLKNSGVKNIEISTLCTACRPDLFWSHRRTGGQRGSQGGIIVCKEKQL